MFLSGKFEHQIDDKFRFRIPVRFKDAIGSHPYVTLGKDNCLYIFSAEHAQERFAKYFSDTDFFGTEGGEKLKDMRKYFSNGFSCDEDKQGRIALNPSLAKEVNITKNIVTIGMLDHLELWAEEEWNKYNGK